MSRRRPNCPGSHERAKPNIRGDLWGANCGICGRYVRLDRNSRLWFHCVTGPPSIRDLPAPSAESLKALEAHLEAR